MNVFFYIVTVITETREQADQVMAERIYFEEDYGFDYEAGFIGMEQPKPDNTNLVRRVDNIDGSNSGL